jgi:hypothetical protein
MSSDWCDDDIDDVAYAAQMQMREQRRVVRELGVHGVSNEARIAQLTFCVSK